MLGAFVYRLSVQSEPLRFPCTTRWTDDDTVLVRLLDGAITMVLGPCRYDEWCPLLIEASSPESGAEFITHVARWMGLSAAETDRGTPPLRLEGTILVTAWAPSHETAGGKLTVHEPHAELYFHVQGGLCRFSEKDEDYAVPWLRQLTWALRDGPEGPTEFPRKVWEPHPPLVEVGPAGDLDPRFAIDVALRLAARSDESAVRSTETLRSMLIDPRTCGEALVITHARFVAATFANESMMRGREKIDRTMLLDALATSAQLLDPEFEEEALACLDDLRLLWAQA